MPPDDLDPASIYRAPAAVAEGPAPNTDGLPQLYVVSQPKFVILFVGTFGLYQIVWFYKHWRAQRDATGQAMMPVARALFAIFFVHKLFAAIHFAARQVQPTFAWPHASQATLFVVLSIVGVVIDRAVGSAEFGPMDWISIALGMLVVVPMLGAQRAANIASGDPAGAGNANLTPLNMVFLAFGTLWWGLVLFGTFLPEEPLLP